MTDCEGYADFEREFGEAFAADVLLQVCETYRNDQHKWIRNVKLISRETLDREGANHRIQAEVRVKSRRWSVTVQDGNWSGTVVEEWDRSWIMPSRPLPRNTLWIFMPVGAIVTKIWVEGRADRLRTAWMRFLETGKEWDAWRELSR